MGDLVLLYHTRPNTTQWRRLGEYLRLKKGKEQKRVRFTHHHLESRGKEVSDSIMRPYLFDFMLRGRSKPEDRVGR